VAIDDVVVAEGTNGTWEAAFTVSLGVASAQTVSVDFATADVSAQAGADYVATNGTLVFNPGELNKTISVAITADFTPEPDEEFLVQLSNAVNAPISRGTGRCTITEVHVDNVSVDVAVRFNTVPQRNYVLEKSDDLVTWTAVAGAESIPGTGSLVTGYDRNAGCNPNRTYRARLLP
jgi:hypothetical protein